MGISPIKTAGGQKNFRQASLPTDSMTRFYKIDVKRIIRTLPQTGLLKIRCQPETKYKGK